jgi:hypothetical protein
MEVDPRAAEDGYSRLPQIIKDWLAKREQRKNIRR